MMNVKYDSPQRGHWSCRSFGANEPKGLYSVQLAWPVYGWRVIVPAISRLEGDSLTRLVLRLIVAGACSLDEIANIVGVHLNFARAVVATLKDNTLVEQRAGGPLSVTEKGKRLLSRNDEVIFDESKLSRGWIFQDAMSGDVFPFYLPGEIPPPVREPSECYHLPSQYDLAEQPTSPNISEALRVYRFLYSCRLHASYGSGLGADMFDPITIASIDAHVAGDKAADLLSPSHIQIVSPRPERFDILTILYFPPHDPEGWLVKSPFDMPGGYWFRKKIAWAENASSSLAQMLSDWRQQAIRYWKSAQHAQTDLDGVLDALLASHPDLSQVREAVMLAQKGYDLFIDDPGLGDLATTRYSNATEAVLELCIMQTPRREYVATVVPAAQEYPTWLRELAETMKIELPERYLSPAYAEKIRTAAQYGGQILRDRALVLLVEASLNMRSRFRLAIEREPRLLTLIDGIYRDRNEYGAHYSATKQAATIKDIRTVVPEVRSAALTVIRELVTAYYQEAPHVQA